MRLGIVWMLALLAGCATSAPAPSGPVDIDALWGTWALVEGEAQEPGIASGERLLERYRMFKETSISDRGVDTIRSFLWDSRACRTTGTGDCRPLRSRQILIKGDSVIDYSIPTVKEKRKILALSAESMVLGIGGTWARYTRISVEQDSSDAHNRSK